MLCNSHHILPPVQFDRSQRFNKFLDMLLINPDFKIKWHLDKYWQNVESSEIDIMKRKKSFCHFLLHQVHWETNLSSLENGHRKQQIVSVMFRVSTRAKVGGLLM